MMEAVFGLLMFILAIILLPFGLAIYDKVLDRIGVILDKLHRSKHAESKDDVGVYLIPPEFGKAIMDGALTRKSAMTSELERRG